MIGFLIVWLVWSRESHLIWPHAAVADCALASYQKCRKDKTVRVPEYQYPRGRAINLFRQPVEGVGITCGEDVQERKRGVSSRP